MHILNIVLRSLLQHIIEIVVIATIFSSYILMINFALYHVVYIASLLKGKSFLISAIAY